MTARYAAALLAACVALRAASSHAQTPPVLTPNDPPNYNFVIEPPPPAFSGLWALGHRCGVRSGWLRVTATTLAFADKPPVRYDYMPEAPHHLMGYIMIRNPHDQYIYDLETHIVSPDVTISDPDELYYSCSGPNPGWPPRQLEDLDAVFDRLVARLIHVRLSDDDDAEMLRIYFIKGRPAFRQIARLLDAGRRAEVRARFRQFEKEMAVDPILSAPNPAPAPDHAGR